MQFTGNKMKTYILFRCLGVPGPVTYSAGHPLWEHQEMVFEISLDKDYLEARAAEENKKHNDTVEARGRFLSEFHKWKLQTVVMTQEDHEIGVKYLLEKHGLVREDILHDDFISFYVREYEMTAQQPKFDARAAYLAFEAVKHELLPVLDDDNNDAEGWASDMFESDGVFYLNYSVDEYGEPIAHIWFRITEDDIHRVDVSSLPEKRTRI